MRHYRQIFRFVVVACQMFFEPFHSHDSLLANGTLVEAASILVKSFMLTQSTCRLKLCVTLWTVEQLGHERMRIGDVSRHVIFALERRGAERTDVTPSVAVGVTRLEVFSQKFLLEKWFFAGRTVEQLLEGRRLRVSGQQVIPVPAFGEGRSVAKLKIKKN